MIYIDSYDKAGNPSGYANKNSVGGMWALEWLNGRELKKMTGEYENENTELEFKYDCNGLRLEKKITKEYSGAETWKYLYTNGKLVAETKSVTETEQYVKYYKYDDSGITGFDFARLGGLYSNNKSYYYIKNIFGDVMKIVDGSGNVVVEYSYDAYGNCEIVQDTTISFKGENISLAESNPIRYRGYYYDNETGLYYLKSRYYDPMVGRFINADDAIYLLLQLTEFSGTNLFAYCLNDPVNYIDPNGDFVFTTAMIVAMIVGAALIGTAGGIIAYNKAKESGAEGWELAGWTILGSLGGGAIGALLGLVIAVAPQIVAAMSTTLTIGGGSILGGGGAALATVGVTVTVGQLVAAGAAAVGAVGLINYMGKRDSGRIRYDDKRVTHDDNGYPFTEETFNKKYKWAHKNDIELWRKMKRYGKGKDWIHSTKSKAIILIFLFEEFHRRKIGK